ncbi:hypothetical protein J4416_04960 [Candidatus Pacearchaeota archaeon]|nr:hypothetical protein [Candidatus Pacearchaeota archaeon]
MKILLILIKVFAIGALLIISNQGLAISDAVNREHFIDEYSSWISHLFDKGIAIVGYVIKSEWLPENP